MTPVKNVPFPATLLLVAWQSYESQPAEMRKNTTTNRWKLLFFNEKSPKTAFFDEILLTRFNSKTFCEEQIYGKSIFTSGHLELYLFKVLGVIYAPSHRLIQCQKDNCFQNNKCVHDNFGCQSNKFSELIFKQIFFLNNGDIMRFLQFRNVTFSKLLNFQS